MAYTSTLDSEPGVCWFAIFEEIGLSLLSVSQDNMGEELRGDPKGENRKRDNREPRSFLASNIKQLVGSCVYDISTARPGSEA
jgi:hypothetical protein